MKAVFCLAFLAFVGLTFGEECSDEDDCDHVTCPESDYTLDCYHGTCTCTHDTATCLDASDCDDEFCRNDWHCVDGQCRCGFGFGGGEIGEPGEPGEPGGPGGEPGGGGPGGAGPGGFGGRR